MICEIVAWDRLTDTTTSVIVSDLTSALKCAYTIGQTFNNSNRMVKVYVDNVEHGHIGYNSNIYFKNGKSSPTSILGLTKYKIDASGKLRKL